MQCKTTRRHIDNKWMLLTTQVVTMKRTLSLLFCFYVVAFVLFCFFLTKIWFTYFDSTKRLFERFLCVAKFALRASMLTLIILYNRSTKLVARNTALEDLAVDYWNFPHIIIVHAIILTDSVNVLQDVESGTCCSDWHTAMHAFRLQTHKPYSGSTVLAMPESGGMNSQVDWQAKQTSHLVCSLAGLSAWGLRNFMTTDRPGRHGIDRQEKGSGWRSGERKRLTFLLRGRERSVLNQTNIVSRATFRRLLRARVGFFQALRCSLTAHNMGLSKHYDVILQPIIWAVASTTMSSYSP